MEYFIIAQKGKMTACGRPPQEILPEERKKGLPQKGE